MKVVVIGGTGTIGSAVVDALSDRHDVVPVGHETGDLRVDISSRDSIERLFEQVASIDAVVSAAGEAAFGPLEELTDEQFEVGLRNKLMGQVDLVRVGLRHANDGGSFTLTSGVLSTEPAPGGAAISLVNAGVEAFARAAALELPRGLRINAVSPPWVSETLEAMGRDPSEGMPAAKVASAFVESVEGRRTGEVLDAREFG